jgi:acyl-CoA reductase-like NAD-dependent aldehyde dehydrogenase
VAFLDDATWQGKIHSSGWKRGGGGEAPVTEPATGSRLASTGIAAPADVAAATAAAAAAQPAWAALPHTERSAVLRRAGDLWKANAAEIEQWSIPEGGKIGPAAQFETHVATEEVYEAATLPSRPYGEPAMPAYAREVFGPVAPVVRFSTADEAAKLAADSEYGLSLGILTSDAMRGLGLARRIPTGIVHINDQTVDDAPNTPFGGILASGTGARFGGTANLDAFTDTRWVTLRGDIASSPF